MTSHPRRSCRCQPDKSHRLLRPPRTFLRHIPRKPRRPPGRTSLHCSLCTRTRPRLLDPHSLCQQHTQYTRQHQLRSRNRRYRIGTVTRIQLLPRRCTYRLYKECRFLCCLLRLLGCKCQDRRGCKRRPLHRSRNQHHTSGIPTQMNLPDHRNISPPCTQCTSTQQWPLQSRNTCQTRTESMR